MNAAVEFTGVSKHYRGARRYRALRDDVHAAAARVLGRGTGEAAAVVRALDDVSFRIDEGETIGILGPNGSGKTTTLKLMSRITYPTIGSIRVRGRVGALIEVGAGLHPELTGRENIRLYGRILGLSGRDVGRRFDEIVEFAELERAIDQPLKHYSSGMQLRLGFSIAAHLEPDILLVDEALAVGDARFHYRCTERMRALVRNGRTLVLVSHDVGAVETLCERAILLQEGVIRADGPARAVIRSYLESVRADQVVESAPENRVVGAGIDIVHVDVLDGSGIETDVLDPESPMTVRLRLEATERIPGPAFTLGIATPQAGLLALASMLIDGEAPAEVSGAASVECAFDALPLQPGVYEIWGGARGESGYGELIDWQRLRVFRVRHGREEKGRGAVSFASAAPLRIEHRWRTDADDSGVSCAG